jgi:uncharacterized membrane protein
MEAPNSIVICPNCSLSQSGALWFFASVCAVSLGVGLLMTLKGFWPILPFAGLELAVLGWALRRSLARRHHRQTITVSDENVTVESREGHCCVEVMFPRHWAQVKLQRPSSRLHPSRLTIESHGRQCEVGSFLTEEERLGLALRLKRLIGRVNESPSLA